DEDLRAVQDVAIALPLGTRADRAPGVGPARGLGDRDERLVALADRRHRVLLDLLARAAEDDVRRVEAERAARRDVRPHLALRRLLRHEALAEQVEARPAP